jgi:replication initiation and membrane attachment protein DnaB
MVEIKELTSFYEAIRDDPRIGTTHISLYMALFQLYNMNGFKNPININRRQVMAIAKISGLATFHKCIKHLDEFGYIQYLPSYDSMVGSVVYLSKV